MCEREREREKEREEESERGGVWAKFDLPETYTLLARALASVKEE